MVFFLPSSSAFVRHDRTTPCCCSDAKTWLSHVLHQALQVFPLKVIQIHVFRNFLSVWTKNSHCSFITRTYPTWLFLLSLLKVWMVPKTERKTYEFTIYSYYYEFSIWVVSAKYNVYSVKCQHMKFLALQQQIKAYYRKVFVFSAWRIINRRSDNLPKLWVSYVCIIGDAVSMFGQALSSVGRFLLYASAVTLWLFGALSKVPALSYILRQTLIACTKTVCFMLCL